MVQTVCVSATSVDFLVVIYDFKFVYWNYITPDMSTPTL